MCKQLDKGSTEIFNNSLRVEWNTYDSWKALVSLLLANKFRALLWLTLHCLF